jgi:hypothetical protein
MEVCRPMPRFGWMYVGLRRLIIGFVALVLIIVALMSVGGVPPISGKLVDALTGKPVAGMDVCLEAYVIDWGKREVVRSEVTRSDSFGEFYFSYSIHNSGVFRHWAGYALTVTDPNAEMVPTCGAIIPAFSRFTTQLNEGRTWAPVNAGKPVYFPVELVQNPSPLDPLNQKMRHFWGGEIALIPLLQNAGECQGIRDSSLAPFCREMNNSAASSLIRTAIQQASGTQ